MSSLSLTLSFPAMLGHSLLTVRIQYLPSCVRLNQINGYLNRLLHLSFMWHATHTPETGAQVTTARATKLD